MKAEDKEKLFLIEKNCLEYWVTQISLSGELGIKDKMNKRLNWVEKQLNGLVQPEQPRE